MLLAAITYCLNINEKVYPGISDKYVSIDSYPAILARENSDVNLLYCRVISKGSIFV